MKITEVLEKISTTNRNKALQLKVRELDEEPKGTFIGFVDEEHSSFDVALTIKNNVLKEHRCDCSLNDVICIHQIAVLLYLTNETSGTKKARSAKKSSKLTEAQILLQELDMFEVRRWLHQFFTVNKEAEIQFLLAFSKQNNSYEVTDIPALITGAFTSVVAKRKKIELNELKKIIAYLDQSLAPVYQYLQTIITNQEAYLLLEAIIDNLYDKYIKHTIPGTRLQKYESQLINQFALLLNNIQEVSVWKKAIDVLINQIFEMDFGKIPFLLIRTIASLNSNGSDVQKQYIAAQIANRLQEFIQEDFYFRQEINQYLLEILIENNQLKACYEYFTPYPYQNTYNILLLNGLKDIDKEQTLLYCYDLIKQNSKQDYNVPYLKIIEEILENEDTSKKELAAVKHDLFLFEPNFSNYQFIVTYLDNPTYIPKFRKNTLARLRNNFDQGESFKTLYLQILESEENYKQMVEVIKDTPLTFSTLKPFLNKLVKLDKKAVFISLGKGVVLSLITKKKVEESVDVLSFAQANFNELELKMIVENFWNTFYEFYSDRIRTEFFAFFLGDNATK